MSFRNWERKRQGKEPLPEKNPYDDSRLFMKQEIHLNDGSLVLAEMWGEDGHSYLTYYCPKNKFAGMSKEKILDELVANEFNISKNSYDEFSMSEGSSNNEYIRLTKLVG